MTRDLFGRNLSFICPIRAIGSYVVQSLFIIISLYLSSLHFHLLFWDVDFEMHTTEDARGRSETSWSLINSSVKRS